MKIKLSVPIQTCAALLLAMWIWKTYVVVRPAYDLQSYENSQYKVWYPRHWPKVDRVKREDNDPYVSFKNHDPYVIPALPNDLPRWRLSLKDEGADHASENEIIERIRNEERVHFGEPGQIEIWRLKNGVAAKTWSALMFAGEISVPVRWIVFTGSNGHVYAATYDVPDDWKTRWRYEYFFKNILGSMEFKTPSDESSRPSK